MGPKSLCTKNGLKKFVLQETSLFPRGRGPLWSISFSSEENFSDVGEWGQTQTAQGHMAGLWRRGGWERGVA